MTLPKALPAAFLHAEGWIVWLLGAAAFAAVPVVLGGIGLSWDAINHHIYLGWIIEHPRFDRDFAAAFYQAYQYPFLYWPVYKLAMGGASGVFAGVVLALMQSLAVPPAWIVARACCPGDSWADAAFRWLGVVIAFLGALTLSLLDSTSNDMAAAIPLLWSVALAFLAAGIPQDQPRRVLFWMALSGLAAGIAVGFKLSNGPLALVMPLAWAMARGTPTQRVQRVMLAGVLTIAGFVLAYGYWGWQLWVHTGNPIYPFADGAFDHLRSALGWHR